MNQLRWDPTLREWVAYATHRQDRTFLPPAEYCPLCPTKPGGFPTEVPRESYDIVVFENKFPSLKPDAPDPDEPGSALAPTAWDGESARSSSTLTNTAQLWPG